MDIGQIRSSHRIGRHSSRIGNMNCGFGLWAVLLWFPFVPNNNCEKHLLCIPNVFDQYLTATTTNIITITATHYLQLLPKRTKWSHQCGILINLVYTLYISSHFNANVHYTIYTRNVRIFVHTLREVANGLEPLKFTLEYFECFVKESSIKVCPTTSLHPLPHHL